MPNQIHNQQADPMTLNLTGVAAPVTLPGNGNVTINVGVDSIRYHNLLYTRVGGWIFNAGIPLQASYHQGQNVYLTSPDQSQMVFHYNGP